ncbi:MAG: hypothetical protein IKO80_00040 [Lachnospiraceae bacterium]|nr:hypothetical protein [Lachnospiraceae bacterium]
MRMRRIPAMLTALVLIAGQGAVLAGDTVYASQNPVYAAAPAGSAGEEIRGMPLPSETDPGDEAVSPAEEDEPGEGDGILPEDPATGEDGGDITADPAGEDPEAGDPADGEGEDAQEEDGEALLPGREMRRRITRMS